MKYIAFWEHKDFTPESVQKQLAIHKERGEKGEHVKTIFPPHLFLTESKGFIIFESDDEMEIMKYHRDYSPVLKIKVIPIVEGSKAAELFQE